MFGFLKAFWKKKCCVLRKSRDYAINEYREEMGGVLSIEVTILPRLVALGLEEVNMQLFRMSNVDVVDESLYP